MRVPARVIAAAVVVVGSCRSSSSSETSSSSPPAAAPDTESWSSPPRADSLLLAKTLTATWTADRTRPGGRGELVLRPGGMFSWVENGDDFTVSPSGGTWGVRVLNGREGVLVLGESALRFTLDGDTMVADGQTWKRGAEQAGALASRVLSPPMPPMMSRLVAHRWRKSNDFDLERLAETLAFSADGTFEATYRGSTCRASGTFSINRGELHAETPDNRCDQRGNPGRVAASNEVPRFEGEMLVFYASSYVPEGATGPRRFVHDSYGSGDGIRVRGEYDAAPAVGTPLVLRIRFENPMRDELLLTKISAEYGKTPLVLDGALPGDKIAPGGGAEVVVTLTPISGTTPLRIIAEAKGRTQDWRSWWNATLTLP